MAKSFISGTKFLELEEVIQTFPIYPEHNNDYLEDCKENLREKGIII